MNQIRSELLKEITIVILLKCRVSNELTLINLKKID